MELNESTMFKLASLFESYRDSFKADTGDKFYNMMFARDAHYLTPEERAKESSILRPISKIPGNLINNYKDHRNYGDGILTSGLYAAANTADDFKDDRYLQKFAKSDPRYTARLNKQSQKEDLEYTRPKDIPINKKLLDKIGRLQSEEAYFKIDNEKRIDRLHAQLK